MPVDNASAVGTVFDIKQLAVYDGPGIRTTVFLKGCPLRCMWCHNPEGLSYQPQLMVSSNNCLHCGACIRACPNGGKTCTACGRCIRACPQGLRKLCGKRYTAQELAQKLLRDKDYLAAMSGGVTFSGGEPLLQPDFLCECLRLCRQAGIHTCLDTAGAGFGSYDGILRWTDLVLFDAKHEEPGGYRRVTGCGMEKAQAFLEAVRRAGTPMWVRHVVVPGLTDGEAHMRALAAYVETLPNVQRVQLLPYHTLGVKKYAALGIQYSLQGTPPMDAQLCRQYEAVYFPAYAGNRKGDKTDDAVSAVGGLCAR